MHSLFPAYAADEPRAVALLPPGFRDSNARAARARLAAERRVDPALLAAMREQDAAIPASDARQRNLDALAAGGVAAVVTGQQMGLFLGPLYTFYKAASAVAIARALERESGVRCVPLFWLQTEDHDFVEIARCHVQAPDGKIVELEITDGGVSPRVSLAHRVLGADIEDQIAALERAFGELPHAAELLSLLRAHWRPRRSIVSAFAGTLAALFAEEGLLLLDPRVPAIARLAAPIVRTSIERANEIDEALAERGKLLASHGWSEQVHPRPGVTLSFVHEETATGPRHRTKPEPALLELLATDPLRFSTSALLRPIVQDSLLPTAAYVGGPAEVSYFAQVAALYPLFGLSSPIIAPRARLRCVEEGTRALLAKLGLRAEQAEEKREELLGRIAAASPSAHAPPEAWREKLLRGLLAALDTFDLEGPELDSNLRDPARKTRETVTHAVDRLLERYARALATRDQVAIDRVTRLQAALAPEGTPQERFYALPGFACRYGISNFKRRVLEAIEPFDPTIKDFTP